MEELEYVWEIRYGRLLFKGPFRFSAFSVLVLGIISIMMGKISNSRLSRITRNSLYAIYYASSNVCGICLGCRFTPLFSFQIWEGNGSRSNRFDVTVGLFIRT